MAGLDAAVRRPSDIEGQFGQSSHDETRLRLLDALGRPSGVTASESGERAQLVAVNHPQEGKSEPRKEVVKLDDGRNVEFIVDGTFKVSQMKVDTRTFVRRGNSDTWDVQNTNGAGGQWFGEIEITAGGGYSFQARGDQNKFTVAKSGNMLHSRPDGSILETANSVPVAVTYPDKTTRSFVRDKGDIVSITEVDGTTWTRDRSTVGDFVSAKDGSRRSAVGVDAEGVFTFTDSNRARHSVNRTGVDAITNADGTGLEVRNGQIEKVKRSNGTTVDCTYDDKKRVLSITIGGSSKYARTDGGSSDWTFTENGKPGTPWKGNIEVLPDGTCLYSTPDKNKEYVQPNGKRWIETADKARIDINSDGTVSKVTRPDGSNIQCEYKDGKMIKVTEDWVRSKAVWERKSGTERWFSTDFPGAQRINLSVSSKGSVSYDSVAGTKYTVNVDASQLREKEDGARISLDLYQRVISSTLADKTELKCGYDNTTLNRVEETSNGTTTVWERDAATGNWTSATRPGESRRHVAVDGDAGYRYVELKGDDVTSIRYIDGNARTFERNGNRDVVKVVEKSHSGAATWNRGKNDDWTSGSVKEDRTDVAVDRDGEYKFVRDDGLTQKYLLDGTEDLEPERIVAPEKVEKASAKLWALAQGNMPDANDQKNFQKDMEAFYRRASVLQVSDDQVAQTFESISSLMEADDKTSYLKKADRVELAKQLLRHVAYPRAVDQGYHDTCNVTTVQVVLAARHPEKFVDAVREVATTGAFKTTNGTKFSLDAQSMRPDWQAKLYKPYDPARNSYGRSYASQLFQLTAVNAYYASKGLNRRYEQRAPEGPEDTGERLIDTTNNAVVAKVPSLTCDQMKDACVQVAGVACNIFESNKLNDNNVNKFSSAQDLQTQLLDLQKKDKLPAIIMVNTKQEPYYTETGKGRSGHAPGWHVVTIWNVDRSGRVLVDNQWGRRSDNEGLRRMTVQQMYQAGQP
ncbi:MAG: hypothetical protein K2W95_09750 [Candidatus Obscuribacterales bacterium]|nr:hypothetical protein [Candidatus Obscuribacterales bacterium]